MSFKLVTSLLAIIVMTNPIFAQEANISKQSESAVGQDTETSSVETDASPKAKLSGNLQNMVGNDHRQDTNCSFVCLEAPKRNYLDGAFLVSPT